MINFDEQYYIVKSCYTENTLHLTSAKNTGFRDYTDEKMRFCDGPLFFKNAFKDEIDFKLSSVHLNGVYPVVSNEIYEELKVYDINGFQLFPSIIISDKNEFIENYYFFNFFEKLDCLDLNKSKLLFKDPSGEFNEMIDYKLNEDVLSRIDEEKRLIIQLDRTSCGDVIFHERIVRIFKKYNLDTVCFFKLSEYVSGMEYKFD